MSSAQVSQSLQECLKNFSLGAQQENSSNNVTVMMPMVANITGSTQQSMLVPVTIMIPNFQLGQPEMTLSNNNRQPLPSRRHSVSCSSDSSSSATSSRQIRWFNSTVNDFQRSTVKVPRNRNQSTPNEQLIMEQAFNSNQLPDRQTKEKLAIAVGKTTKWVQTWFQNRRQKQRRHSLAADATDGNNNTAVSKEPLVEVPPPRYRMTYVPSERDAHPLSLYQILNHGNDIQSFDQSIL